MRSADLPFSIMMSVKGEYDLLRHSLPACYSVRPAEVVLCFDKPAPANCVQLAKSIAAQHKEIKTRIIEVERNPEWRFHQAWVRRSGFRAAEHNRILAVDADLIINRNVLKAVNLVGKDNIGLVSCSKFYPIKNPLGLWRAVAYHLARRVHFAPFTGLYAIFRPYWLDSEDEGIKKLEDPRTERALGSLAAVGEDTYLRNCMLTRHRVVYLRDIGAHCMTRYVEDVSHVQFELGRYMAARGHTLRRTLLKAFMYARIHYLRGYLYQKWMGQEIPTYNPYTYHSGLFQEFKRRREYWTQQVPMTFSDSPKTYEEKRNFRYSLQDYMQDFFMFNQLKGLRVLEVGSGSGIDSAEMLRQGAVVISVDFSPLACKSTKSLLQEAGLDGNIIMADATRLPFKDEKFDVAYSHGVLHHVANAWEALEEIRRCLRHNGLFMGMVYNRDSLLYAWLLYTHGIKQGLLAEGKTETEIASMFSERIAGNPYSRPYTRGALNDLLRRFFKRVTVETRYNVIDTEKKRKVKFQLEDGQAELGWHLVFKAYR